MTGWSRNTRRVRRILAPALLFLALALPVSAFPLGGGPWGPAPAGAEPPRVPILFSNIGGAGDDGWPLPRYSSTALGYIVDGQTMVRLRDLADALGARVRGTGGTYEAARNGQTVRFYPGSPDLQYTVSYTIYDPVAGRTVPYTHSWQGRAEAPARLISGQPCVSLTTSALALGALLVRYNSQARRAEVFDWRVYHTAALADPNTYVTGGRWLEGWDGQAELSLSPHFRAGADNLWDTGADDPAYLHQLKMSASALQSMENVLGLTGVYFTPTNAFRSWSFNQALEGSWSRSFHTRGRAFDAGDGDLYWAAYNDIRGRSGRPGDAESFWATRNRGSATQLFEIEKMPVDGGAWLHGQREPGSDAANYGP